MGTLPLAFVLKSHAVHQNLVQIKLLFIDVSLSQNSRAQVTCSALNPTRPSIGV